MHVALLSISEHAHSAIMSNLSTGSMTDACGLMHMDCCTWTAAQANSEAAVIAQANDEHTVKPAYGCRLRSSLSILGAFAVLGTFAKLGAYANRPAWKAKVLMACTTTPCRCSIR